MSTQFYVVFFKDGDLVLLNTVPYFNEEGALRAATRSKTTAIFLGRSTQPLVQRGRQVVFDDLQLIKVSSKPFCAYAVEPLAFSAINLGGRSLQELHKAV